MNFLMAWPTQNDQVIQGNIVQVAVVDVVDIIVPRLRSAQPARPFNARQFLEAQSIPVLTL